MEKISLPKGTRDFGSAVMVKRDYIMSAIKKVFRLYGFQPIETPAMENLSTLTGKYGEEGDQLIYKVLNSGDFLKNLTAENKKIESSELVVNSICEKGLRYDLTVPFARYVTMNRHNIEWPFKRYQMQPVWRADRPQKGRYREFYQCDADVIGTNSLICEVDIILMISQVFKLLNISDYTIRVNHRAILNSLAKISGQLNNQDSLFIAIDKLKKVGQEKVRLELLSKGMTKEQIELVFEILNFKGSTTEKITFLTDIFSKFSADNKGLLEFSQIMEMLKSLQYSDRNIELDFKLARGLSYYTGSIFEVEINSVAVGSVGGGGRYDDLTSNFGMPNISGVGFSFGLDRLYDAMEELNIFPATTQSSTTVLLCHLDERCQQFAIGLQSSFRERDISTEVYPDIVKIKKQLEYANKKGINYAIIIGEEELQSKQLTLKNLFTGNQNKYNLAEIIQKLDSKL